MSVRSYTLALIALMILLAMTLFVPFAGSMYVYATIKALIILFVFMHTLVAERTVKIYLAIAVFLVIVLVTGILDDVLFRSVIEGRPTVP